MAPVEATMCNIDSTCCGGASNSDSLTTKLVR